MEASERMQGPKIQTRLAPESHRKFMEMVKERRTTVADLGREAILFYMEQHQTQADERRDSRLERRLKTIEDRYASLLVRIGIDTGTIMALLSSRIDPAKRREILDNCYRTSVKHFNQKLEGVAREMKVQLSEANRKESENAERR